MTARKNSSDQARPQSAFAVQEPPSPFPDGLWAWGIDISTKRIAIATMRGRQWDLEMIELDNARLSWVDALLNIRDEVRATTERITPARLPGVIALEEPFGIGNKTRLLTVFTAVAIGLREGLGPYAANIIPVGSTTWKKKIIGRGDAKKPDILLYARIFFDPNLTDQDAADALCIAEWAHRQEIRWSS